jgi:hypothetical protein
VLDADREADVIFGHAGRELFLGRELRVGGGRRMDGERARVADIGDMIEELERVDELALRLLAAPDLEADQAAEPAMQDISRPAAWPRPSDSKDGSRA